MYAEADYLPLSALQHWVFCPRQCGLIHLEQVWNENRLTAEGRIIHQRVHEMSDERRSDIYIVRGLRIYSCRLGLIGQADVVEFHRAPTGISLSDAEGMWQPYPVEYKRGSPKMDACDEVQLCAQAICLEEMLGIAVPLGAFFYGRPRRRKEVVLTDELRRKTEESAHQLHEMFQRGRTPGASYEKKCRACSLYNQCLPKTTGKKKNIEHYLQMAYELPREEMIP